LDAILNTVLPVFGMIVLGYGFARADIVDATAARGITQFVFNVAIPALLFRTVATMEAQEAAPWGLWMVFFGGLATTWIATALVSRGTASLSPSGGAAASMAAGFGNLALLGTPLALSHFGTAAAVPLGMILSIHAPILWFAATMHRELARHSGGFSFARTGRDCSEPHTMPSSLPDRRKPVADDRLRSHPFLPHAECSDASVPTALRPRSVAGYPSLRGRWGGMFTLIGPKMVLMPVRCSRRALASAPRRCGPRSRLCRHADRRQRFLFAQRNDETVPPSPAP
jgi:hypothetical protein